MAVCSLRFGRSHLLCVSVGANITGLIPGFNNTILNRLPSSMLLIVVESVLMGFAFLAMIIVRAKRKRPSVRWCRPIRAGFPAGANQWNQRLLAAPGFMTHG